MATITHSPYYLTALHDWFVHELSALHLWGCPTLDHHLPFYTQHATSNHIDLGTGTGFFASHTPFPSDARITLVDGPRSKSLLRQAAERVTRANRAATVQIVQADLVDSASYPAILGAGGGGKADSVSAMNILHGIAGQPKEKQRVLANAATLLKQSGTLFGTTVLGHGAQHSNWGWLGIKLHNLYGSFANEADVEGDILRPLYERFQEVEWRIEGVVLIFRASGLRDVPISA